MNRRSFHKLSLGAGIASLLPNEIVNPVVTQGQDHAGLDFSVMLWILQKDLGFEQKMQMVADAGYRSAEIGNEYLQWTSLEWKRNLAKKHALGMSIDSAVPGRNALAHRSKRDALRDDLLKAVPGAKELGCSQFIYTAYTRVPGQTPEQQRAAIVDTLKYAAEHN